MDGIFVDGQRPKSKKAVKEFVRNSPNLVEVEITRLGAERTVPLALLENGQYHFVGPDPYTNRRFYGTLSVSGEFGAEKDREYHVV